MKGDYPRFQAVYTHEELVVHFLLTSHDVEVIDRVRGEVNRQGVALLLKSLSHLGYFPDEVGAVPQEVRDFLAHQLTLLWDASAQYPADERTQRYHQALIREHTGWQAPTAHDKETLEHWLRTEGTQSVYTEEGFPIVNCRGYKPTAADF